MTAITLDQHAPEPLYQQLYERLRTAILAGQLQPGAALPSMRTLAAEMGISRNTTALAYELLQLEGYIESRVGSGTRVVQVQPEQLAQMPARPTHRHQADAAPPQDLARRCQLLLDTPDSGVEDAGPPGEVRSPFRIGEPDVAAFPYDIWARLVAHHARHSLPTVARYQSAQGYTPLREAIAAHIGITRGVHCAPEQIVLTAGSQGALDLIGRVLLNPGDQAWVEAPGYTGARGALLAAGAALVPVPVDQEGMDVAAGQAQCAAARLAIVTPSHQFPTGVTMSLRRRLELLQWANTAHAWLVEDDYDSEFRFSGRPLEALHGLDRAGRVIYIGTFSKTLYPSLRLGFLVAPMALLPGFLAMRRLIDTHLPLLEQLALADFITQGHFARHIRKMRLRYRERRDALVGALREALGDLLEVAVPEAGLHLVAWLPATLRAEDVVARAAHYGLPIRTITQPRPHAPAREGLVFGFAAVSPAELRAGVRTLARAVRADY
ncbi:MAG TPA: PLP-dependent aminotransferase family protein [Roseiflexaceae bacterium]|nr:PLP-dependent aminotransferase family protein [Roseiflexaceae bacterium]